MMDTAPWKKYVDELDFSPLFVTISGAHLYGFPSPDSDVDLRGCHQLPLEKIVGLELPSQTIDRSGMENGIEVDIVSHDIGKYFGLLVKNNGLIIEQIFSPLVVSGLSFLERLRPVAKRCITRHHYHHYRGFYRTQRGLIEKETEKKAKSVLYAYRALMTGLHLCHTGMIEPNICVLNEEFNLPYIESLIAMKSSEKVAPKDLDWTFHAAELDRLEIEMATAFEGSKVTENRDRDAVNDLLLELRLGSAV